ncbi:unnamed protein product [Ilex paraguariensis]|uniref:Pentatricopeptide repeat-containing protein n=1 Tax=Ilex paraguariensis TaxID=185542 RepID=A0ABC8QUA1_9AQUA
MEMAGIHPDTYTYTTLMDAYCKYGEMVKAHELLGEMLDRELQPTVFIKRKKYLEARDLFKEMRKEGLVADREFYYTFIDMTFDEGNTDMTLELCDEAIEKCLVDETNNGN